MDNLFHKLLLTKDVNNVIVAADIVEPNAEPFSVATTDKKVLASVVPDGIGLELGVGVGVPVFVGVIVLVGVLVGVFVGVFIGVTVLVGVLVGVKVGVGVVVCVGVIEGVGVIVCVGVILGVGVGETSGCGTFIIKPPTHTFPPCFEPGG